MTPKISVIIPLYNKEKIVERSVNSVLNQSFKDFELIIVDDGSTDKSFEIVNKIKDDRIKLIKQKNAGPSAARNRGVKESKTDWVLFLDSDDELLKDALEHFILLITKYKNADIYNCGSEVRSGTNKTIFTNSYEGYVKSALKDWFFGNLGPGTGHSVFSRKILEKYPYNEKIRRFEDAELLIRVLPKAKVYSCKKIVFTVNSDFSSASGKRRDISEDYSGNLSMKGKTFWARMCVYRLFLENRELYPKEMHRLYPSWYWRFDLLFLFKVSKIFK
ncbi:glycosyltransferase family 2 protein [Prevotella koreensis]